MYIYTYSLLHPSPLPLRLSWEIDDAWKMTQNGKSNPEWKKMYGPDKKSGWDGTDNNAGDSYIITPTAICESWGIIIIEL